MPDFIGKIEFIRRKYPYESAVKFIKVEDSQGEKPGVFGHVQRVDDDGIIYVKWDTGPISKVVYGVDEIERLTINDTLRAQIKIIENINMFRLTHVKYVKAFAHLLNLKELSEYLEDEENEKIYLVYVVYGML